MHRLVPAAVAALLAGVPAHAQDRTRGIDSIFSFATAETPGCAVGVSQRGRVIVNRAYGLADVERRAPLGQRSLFDIGSTQKQFTAAAVLLLVEDGRLALSDDVRKYLPELPDYGRTVTVDHLLTHTSGIRDWTGMLPLAEEGTAVLPLILRQRGLDFAPGTEWSYSSSGFELAKEIVARVSGMPFAEFARRRLFEPLGMKSSAYVPDILRAGANAALGYQKEGAGWKPYMRLGNNRGGGAIVSTVGDLVTWTDALATGRLGRFVTAKIQEPARLANGRRLEYARGLVVDSTPGGLVVSHSGGAAGFSTWMGHVPEHGLSVAVSCNFDPVSATALAGSVADLYLPPPPAAVRAEAAAAAAGAAGVDPAARAGLFFDERTGQPMRLQVSEGRLRIANGPPLVALSADRFRPLRPALFFRSQDAFEMTFLSNDQFEIRSMEGQTTRYRRAQPWTPTAADLRAVEGRYESTELGSVFEILPGAGGGLVMRFERAPDKAVELAPVERDTYMLRMMSVRFRRDAGGRVVGFDYGNPAVRSIPFTRLGDRATGAPPPPTTQPPAAPAAAPAAPASAAPRLEGLTGEYELAPGRTLAITLEDGRLHGQPSGGGAKRPLAHVSGTTFSAVDTPITLTFTLGADGRATALVMRQNGNERTLPKVR
ncbi:MAG: serine hydrolase [Longimicrobiaceae bacterium]